MNYANTAPNYDDKKIKLLESMNYDKNSADVGRSNDP
jgi:hypothetical protein